MKIVRLGHNNYMKAIGGCTVRTKKYTYFPSRVADDDTIEAWWRFPRDFEFMFVSVDVWKSRYDEVEIVEK